MFLLTLVLVLIIGVFGVYENTLIIELSNSSTSSVNRNGLRSPIRDDSSSNLVSRIQEVKELVSQMNQVFNSRLDKLNEVGFLI